ncbi:MAG: hypothetical protein EOO18_12610, partial [Chryseobacterium sp.]
MGFKVTEQEKKSFAITSSIFVILFLVMFYIKFSGTSSLVDLEGGGGGGGVTVNFGDSDVGSGADFKSEVLKVTDQKQEKAAAAPVAEDEVLASDLDDAPTVVKTKPPVINRIFFESAIARIILFRSMEKIYAEKKIGNLRAAVIPYSISVLFNLTDGSGNNRFFDLTRIWQQEGLEEDLSDFLCELMQQMNELIKKYATSDDPSENSKTKELWERVWDSKEIETFSKGSNTAKIIRKYSIPSEEYRKKLARSSGSPEVNFQLLQDNVFVHSNGVAFYQNLLKLFT